MTRGGHTKCKMKPEYFKVQRFKVCGVPPRMATVVGRGGGFIDLVGPNFAGHVVLVDRGLLDEDVQRALVLSERVAGDLVDELLQILPSVLDELLLEDAVVRAEWQLALQRLAGKRRHHDLAVSLQLSPQPLEVAVSPPHARLLLLEHRQIRSHADLVVGVAHLADAVRNRVDDLDFEKVGGRRVRFIERLALRAETLRRDTAHDL
ncbi:hypothetical protein PFISCL1PPCAC_18538, partial [Pristionchus fissidentatus]